MHKQFPSFVAAAGVVMVCLVAPKFGLAQEKSDKFAQELKIRTYDVLPLPSTELVALGTTYGVVFSKVVKQENSFKLVEVSSVKLPGSVNSLAVVSSCKRSNVPDVLVASLGPDGIALLDYSTIPQKPAVVLKLLKVSGAAWSVAYLEPYLFVACGTTGIDIFKVDFCRNKFLHHKTIEVRALRYKDDSGKTDVPGLSSYVRQLLVQKTGAGSKSSEFPYRLLVANGRAGLALLTLDEKLHVEQTRFISMRGDVRWVLPFANGFLVSLSHEGLCYLDGNSLELEGCINSTDVVRGAAVISKKEIVVGDGATGLIRVNWSIPDKPLVSRPITLPGSVNNVRFYRGKLYVAADYGGALVLEASSPRSSR